VILFGGIPLEIQKLLFPEGILYSKKKIQFKNWQNKPTLPQIPQLEGLQQKKKVACLTKKPLIVSDELK